MAKPSSQAKLQALAGVNQLSLIAIDEAPLYTEWCSFRSAFTDLKNLKYNFPDTPIMALTAKANSVVEDEIKILLRHPVIEKASMDRPNIALYVDELESDKSFPPEMEFGTRASEIVGSSAAIVYTDFITDIGPIVSSLSENGIQAVGYHGEMDTYSRHESYLQWKSGEAQAIVATKAFGMGIDKSDIRHVIRNGVPENMLSWAQELGRCGRDGKNATATILYRKSDLSHAND